MTQQFHEADYDCALRLGLDWDEIRALEALTLLDFQVLTTLSPHFIRIEVQIDHAQLNLALRRVDDYKRSQEIQHRLLVHGAPRHLMSRLYGWIPQQYRSQRCILRLDEEFPNGGRPPNPSLTEEESILAHWDRLADLDLPERYLETALAAKVSVRQVCRALSLREERDREALEATASVRLRSAASGSRSLSLPWPDGRSG
ncbi:DUF2857 family protein [Thiorhodococcus minor]|uniref:DUF2857 family protein n=2 Tax=Thiorhodococcus minor TaxID=57489 RepID=A0A6M0JVS0_9GAMM|nr:DUF2857 family protein [Thiorhodococcus minor]